MAFIVMELYVLGKIEEVDAEVVDVIGTEVLFMQTFDDHKRRLEKLLKKEI